MNGVECVGHIPGAKMQVALGDRRAGRMPQQLLKDTEVDARFGEVRAKGVPKAVGIG